MSEQNTQANQVVRYENISQQVLEKIKAYQQSGDLTLPPNYAPENHLKSAWLIITETKDRNDKPALTVCTKESIANALLDMVISGLSVAKKQGYFIVYGNKLTFLRSYFGSVALAKRVTKGEFKEPIANVIYEGDDFVYEIDPTTGRKKIIKHSQDIANINNDKIKGAYCIVTVGDSTDVEIMTLSQIKKAWEQGATKGGSMAHKNFTDEMCKKTVIGRACKMTINSSDDAGLYDGMKSESDTDNLTEQRNEEVKTEKKVVVAEEIEYSEVVESPKAEKVEEEKGTNEPAY